MTRTPTTGNQGENPAIAAARHRRGGRHHSRGLLWLVAARLADQRHRHRVARRRHAEPASCERGFDDRARRICIRRVGDYAIWTETAEFARGNRPDYFAESLNAGALVRLDVDTLPGARPQSRNARLARASMRRRPGIRDSAGSGTARRRSSRASRRASSIGQSDSVRGIVQRARGPGAVRRAARSSTTPAPASRRAGSPSRAPSRPPWSSAWAASRRGRCTGFPVANLDRAGPARGSARLGAAARRSPRTCCTRVAGRSHVNGYLILRDQVGTPIWLVQLEIPRSAYAQATRTTLYQTILLGLLVGGFTIVAMLLVARSRRLNADRSSLESRYRAIIEQAQDGLLVADARTGEIVDANPAVQQQLGFTLDELRGRSVLSVLRGPNDSQDPVIATLARVEPSRGIELVQWLKDGRQMDVEVSCVPIESQRPPSGLLSDARPVRAKEGADPAARQPAAARQARESRSPHRTAEPPVPAGAPARGASRAARKPADARGAVPRPRSLQAHQRLARPRSRRQAAAGNRQARARGGAARGHRRSHGRRRVRRGAAQGERARRSGHRGDAHQRGAVARR